MTDKSHSQKNQQPSKQVNRLKVAFLLSSCYLASAVIIVLITGSLFLLSEAGH
jgi:Co/Zn/Cd efflux system component